MEILVKMHTGNIIKININLSDSVAEIKEKVFKAENVPLEYQKSANIIYSGKKLNPSLSLSDY